MSEKKLTQKEAIRLSLLKANYIIGNDGSTEDLVEKYTEVEELLHNCGLCELYYYTSNGYLGLCAKCPIRPHIKDYDNDCNTGCAQKCHPYKIWAEDSTSENYQKVKDLIIKNQYKRRK